MDLIFIANVVVLLGRSYIQCLYTFGCGPYFDDVRKKGQILTLSPTHPQKQQCIYCFIKMESVTRDIPLPLPFSVDIIKVWPVLLFL